MNRATEDKRAGWIDISQPLKAGIAVWPGDPEFTSGFSSSMGSGDPYNVGRVNLGLHTGTHAESPLHFERSGRDIAAYPLEIFIGRAQVVLASGQRVIDLSFVQQFNTLPERLLLKTGSGVERGWHEEFACLDSAAAEWLAGRGVRLLGIDSPSVDAARSTSWPAHRALARSGVVVLENLCLDAVQAGWFELVALPLNLPGIEASPVRAVLRPLSGGEGPQ